MTRWLAAIVALVCGVQPAAADSFKDFRAQMRRFDKQERAYWEAYNNRFVKACDTWYEPARKDKRHKAMAVDGDFGEFRILYEECASIEKLRGEACLAFARSGHAKATSALFKTLLQTTLEVDKTEEQLREGNNRVYAGIFDQRPGVRRHGLAFRERLLADALTAAPGDARVFGEWGFGRARKQDAKRRTATARVAWLDIVGARRERACRPVVVLNLASKDPRLRIAALEALVLFGAEARKDLLPLLNDQQPVVRRALLAAVRRDAATDPLWIGPVLDFFAATAGLPRADALQTLKVLTGRDLGDDPKPWRAWYEEHQAAIEGGNFERPASPEIGPEVLEPKTVAFYEIRTPSDRILFMLDGSWALLVPAETEVLKQRHWWHWQRSDWTDEHESNQDVLVRQTRKALGQLQSSARFRILMVGHHSNKEDVIGLFPEKKALQPDARSRKRASEYLAGYKYSWINYDPHYALMRALELEDVDTVFLVYNGHLKACRYLLPEALVADFQRRNRFHRLVLHAVRIGDTGPESGKLLKGLAASSGGTYVWSNVPPVE